MSPLLMEDDIYEMGRNLGGLGKPIMGGMKGRGGA